MAEAGSNQEAVLTSDLQIKGTISFQKALRVHCAVEGAITGPGRVQVARDGKINGNIDAAEVVIEGNVQGDVVATDRVELKPSAQYQGDLRASKLAIEAGANFTGHVTVGADAAKDRAAQKGPVSARPGANVTAKAG